MTGTSPRRPGGAPFIAILLSLLSAAACLGPADPLDPPDEPIDPEQPPPGLEVPAAPECEPTAGGRLFEVGPGEALTSVDDVPWETLTAGDTVRIRWRSEPYRSKILIRGQGTAAMPIKLCGVAGPEGQLPVLDGEDATTRPSMGYRVAGTAPRGLIHLSWGAGDDWGYKPRHVVIQGLHIRNAYHEHSFTHSDGQVMEYSPNAAGIFVERGEDITVRNCVISGNGNGFFVASTGSEEVTSRNILLERSLIHGNGTVSVAYDRHHNIYTEAIGITFQHNVIGPLREGSGGSAFKDRSAGLVFRYNRVSGGARTLDLVEAEDGWPMVEGLPSYRETEVYGNVLVVDPGGATNIVHYGGDNGLTHTYRKGTLRFYRNTVVVRSDQTGPNGRWRTMLFDVATNDESVDARENIVFVEPETEGATPTRLSWMSVHGKLSLGENWASPGMELWRDGMTPQGSITGLGAVRSAPDNDPGFVDEDANDFRIRIGGSAEGLGAHGP